MLNSNQFDNNSTDNYRQEVATNLISQNSDGLTDQSLKMTLSKKQIDMLETLYKYLIDNCKLDYSLSRYEMHFKTIYDSLKSVVKNENDLYDKVLTLKKENNELNIKLTQAVKLAGIDAKVRENLLEKLEKKSVEAAIALNKQKSAIKTVTFQKAEILNLLNLSEQNAGLTMRQNYNLNDLNNQKEKLIAENKRLKEEIDELKSHLEILNSKDKELNKLVEEDKEKFDRLNQEIVGLKLELNKTCRKKEHLESDLKKQNAYIENQEVEVSNLNQTIHNLKIELKNSEKSMKDIQLYLDNCKKINESEILRYQELKSENEELGKKLILTSKENRSFVNLTEQNRVKIEELNVKLVKEQEKQELLEKRIKIVEEQKTELESKITTSQTQFESICKKLKSFELEKDFDKKKIESLVHEKEKAYLELKKSNLYKEKAKSIGNALRMQVKRLDSEKIEAIKQIDNLKKVISDFDKERNDFVSNYNAITLKTNNLSHEIKIKENNIERNEKKIKDYVSKLEKNQQSLDVLRKENNINLRHVSTLKEELRLTKKHSENVGSLEINFKKVLNKKETDNLKLLNENVKLEKVLSQLRKTLSEKELALNEFKLRINSFELAENKLLKITLEMEKKLKNLTDECDKYKIERSFLGQQLIGRNHQISIMFVKISFLEKALKEGESCYNKKLEQLSGLETEHEKTIKEIQMLKNERVLIKSLKNELDSKQNELIMEKAKKSASEKFHKSFNIHRWRKLKGCDPSTYWLILKINMLQKRLIFKTEQLTDLQLKFIEKDKLFLELKNSLTRRILTEETSTIIENNKHTINRISRQFKTALAENQMLIKLNEEQSKKLRELQTSHDDFKQKYFKLKSCFLKTKIKKITH